MAEQSIGGATSGQTGDQVEADGLKSIESRAEARRVAGEKGDPQRWVQADLRDFARLQERWQQEHAGVVMAENARTEAAYKTALAKEAPDMAVRVQELDAANDAKVWAKEDRKNEAYAAGKREEAEVAQRWTPEQASALALAHAKELRQTQDVTERRYAGEDMAVNARNSPAYRAALEAQAPDVAKELAERHKEALHGQGNLPSDGPSASPGENAQRDISSTDTIQRRSAELRDYRDNSMSREQARMAVREDLETLGKINGEMEHRTALGTLGRMAGAQAEYKDELRNQNPGVANEAESTALRDREKVAAAQGEFRGSPEGQARAVEGETLRVAVGQAEAKHDEWRANRSYAERAAAVEASNEPARGPALVIDAATLERLQQVRTRDTEHEAGALGLNGIERAAERRPERVDAESAVGREAVAGKASADQQESRSRERTTFGNKVESDEIFTAPTSDTKAVIPPEVERQYRRDGSKYYELAKPEVVAFEDKGNKLETQSSSEQVAESLVRIAKARGWDEIKVSGSEAFRKEAWLEAAANGMHVKGYTPSEQDKEALAKRSQTEANRVQNEGKPFRGRETEGSADKAQETAAQSRAGAFASGKQSDAIKAHPELVGAYVATAAVERKAEADGLTAEQRAVVASRVRQNVVNAIERGNVPEAQLNDRIEVRRERDRHDEREVSR